MIDLPRIPDDLYGQLSFRERQMVRDTEVLRMIATASTIDERDRLADRADVALKRLRNFAEHHKQNPRLPAARDGVRRMPVVRRAMPFAPRRRPAPHDERRSVFRVPGLQATILELNGAAINPGSILFRDHNQRFMDMALEIHTLMQLIGWIPSNPS